MASFEIPKKKWTGDGAKLEDSNMANVGSGMDKRTRKKAAKNEPAWEGAGAVPGLLIWRVEKFKIVAWPKEQYGKFCDGDSYICLSTVKDKESDKLLHDIHFWLGSGTTQDEMGTAAYKTVELDDLLDQVPIQHREVEKMESGAFQRLFKQIEYLAGGVESGFNHVEAGTFIAKLLHIRKTKHTIKVIEVPCKRESLNQGDCFILDLGEKLYPWFGESSSAFEKAKAGTVASNIEGKRHGKSKVLMSVDSEFWAALGGEGAIADDAAEPKASEAFGEGILYKLSDDSGKLMCTEVARGDLRKSMLGTDDVYMLDAGLEIFMYVGKKASDAERRNAMGTAISYLASQNKGLGTPIHVIKEGQAVKLAHWNKVFSD